MGTFWYDFRQALRSLKKTPAFTALAVLLLALGIGANSGMFSLVQGILLRPPAFSEPDQLAMLFEGIPQANLPKMGFSPPDLVDLRAYQSSFSEVAAFSDWTVEISGSGEPVRLPSIRMTANLFRTLGVQPALGRDLLPGEDAPGNDVVVLSYSFWQSRFGGSPEVLGTALNIDRRPHTIIGVMPASFEFPLRGMTELQAEPASVFVPMAFTESDLAGRGMQYNNPVIARLADGQSLETVRSELPLLAERITEGYPPILRDGPYTLELSASALRTEVVGTVEKPLWLLLGAMGLVLLVVCANVANLTLSRAASRRSEMAVRHAFGASRRRLIQLLLSESAVLAMLGGVLGMVLAQLAITVVLPLLPAALPLVGQVELDATVLVFTVIVTCVTLMLCGLMPLALTDSTRLEGVLREASGKTTVSPRQDRVQQGLVVATVALAVVLLVGAGLLLRSFGRLLASEPGFSGQQVLTLGLTLPNESYGEPGQVRAFSSTFQEAVTSLPGVRAASLSTALPMSFSERRAFSPDLSETPETPPSVTVTWTHGPYFDALGIPLLKGRTFTLADREDSELVAIISQELARRFWGDEDPVGKRLKWGVASSSMPWFTICGVVGDVNDGPLGSSPNPHIYVPYMQYFDRDWQWAAASGSSFGRELRLAVAAEGDPTLLIQPVVDALRQLDKSLPVIGIRTMDEVVGSTVSAQRFSMTLVGTFAGLALFLAAVGLYGILLLGVVRRRREIGIRMALGANRGDVVGLIVRRGMALVSLGLALGLGASMALTRVLQSELYEIEALDFGTYGAVLLVLLAVAFLASFLPARRAGRVEPFSALRAE